jgi:hypothetical protein
MPVPTSATYSVTALVTAHTSFRDLVDSHATLAGSVKIRSAADVLLATIPLTDPSGSVNGGTGQLTLTPDGRDESADTAGTAAYAEVCDGAGAVHLSIPCQAGTEPVSGYCVLNTLTIAQGGPVELVGAVIG